MEQTFEEALCDLIARYAPATPREEMALALELALDIVTDDDG